jgi:predicted acylesterase/phospholipase RssA
LTTVLEGLQADDVLQGGGVKGIGLVGALVALTDAGYRFNRISGTPAGAIVGSLAGREQAHLNQPWVSARTVRVDSTEVGVLEFGITDAETQVLYQSGFDAASTFLSAWDWPAYIRRFRQGMTGPG